MTKSELKAIIRECYYEEILDEGFLDNYKARSQALKEISNWISQAKTETKNPIHNISTCKKLIKYYESKENEWKSVLNNRNEYRQIDNKNRLSYYYCELKKIVNNNYDNSKIDGIKISKQIKIIEDRLYSDDKFLSKIESISKKAIENGSLELSDIKPTISGNKYIPKLSSKYTGENYIVIINQGQDCAITFVDILYVIVKELKKLPEYKKCRFSYGDGDEGCIYWK